MLSSVRVCLLYDGDVASARFVAAVIVERDVTTPEECSGSGRVHDVVPTVDHTTPYKQATATYQGIV
jgi:hypothetical protein